MSEEQVNTPLYNAQNLYYFGAYQACLNACNTLSNTITTDFKTDLNLLVYRCYLSMNKINLILTEIKSSETKVELLAFKILAQIYQSDETKLEDLKQEIKTIIEDGTNLLNPSLQIIGALAYYKANDLESALKAVSIHPKHLECVAIKTQILLKVNRVDLAKKELNSARNWAEDVPLIQLMEGWIDLYLGGKKIEEAFNLFEELSQHSFASTCKLLNSKAVAYLHIGQYQVAEETLLEALNKDSDDETILANLVVCSQLTGKSTEIKERYLNQLKAINPKHFLLLKLDEKSNQFDEFSKKFALVN